MANPKPSNSFKKGKDPRRNTNGRPPKGYSITEMMKEMLDANPEIKKGIGQRIAKKALEGDMTAIKTLWQYMDGMPDTNVNLGNKGGEPLKVVYTSVPQINGGIPQIQSEEASDGDSSES